MYNVEICIPFYQIQYKWYFFRPNLEYLDLIKKRRKLKIFPNFNSCLESSKSSLSPGIMYPGKSPDIPLLSVTMRPSRKCHPSDYSIKDKILYYRDEVINVQEKSSRETKTFYSVYNKFACVEYSYIFYSFERNIYRKYFFKGVEIMSKDVCDFLGEIWSCEDKEIFRLFKKHFSDLNNVLENHFSNIEWKRSFFMLYCKEFRDVVLLLLLMNQFSSSNFSKIPKDVLVFVIIPFIGEINLFCSNKKKIKSIRKKTKEYEKEKKKILLKFKISDGREKKVALARLEKKLKRKGKTERILNKSGKLQGKYFNFKKKYRKKYNKPMKKWQNRRY